MYPALKEFKRFWKEFDRITVYREMEGDMDTPVSMLARFLPFERVILLESAEQNKTYSRFSFLAFSTPRKARPAGGRRLRGRRAALVPSRALGGCYAPVKDSPPEDSVTFTGATWAISTSSSWESAAS